MRFHIDTEHLILREIRPADAEAFFRMDSNSEVHRYLGNNPVKTIEHIHQVIERLLQQYADFGIARWAAIEKSTGDFIGWSGLKYIVDDKNSRNHFYDVGYRFHPDYWGKGYATESTVAALKYGFETMQLSEIIGTCHRDNKASRRVLEKCGLHYIESFVSELGLPCDWLSINKSEWVSLKK